MTSGRDSNQASLDQRVATLLEKGLPGEACSLIIEELGPEVQSYLRKVMGPSPESEDLFQTVCARLFESLAGFRGECSVRSWFYMIARRKFATWCDRYSRGGVVRLDTAHEDELHNESARNIVSILGSVEQRTHQQQLLRKNLTPEELELIILRTEQRLSHQDIGAALGIGEEAARQRWKRVKRKVMALIDGPGSGGKK